MKFTIPINPLPKERHRGSKHAYTPKKTVDYEDAIFNHVIDVLYQNDLIELRHLVYERKYFAKHKVGFEPTRGALFVASEGSRCTAQS